MRQAPALPRSTTPAYEALLDTLYVLAYKTRSWLYRLTRPTTIGVRALVMDGNRVLLVRHRGKRGRWGLPGGGVKRGETFEQAIRREVMEESGCNVRVDYLHGMFYDYCQGFNDYIAVFVCTPLSNVEPPQGDIEIATAEFVPVTSMPEGMFASCRQRIAEFARGERSVTQAW